MKILVAGAGGQVGTALQQQAETNITILPYTRDELDITSETAVMTAISDAKPDVVINAAAYTAVDKAEEERECAFAVNRDGPANLAKACALENIPFLHISTDFVFDGQKSGAYLETDKCAPLSVYGASKWEGEKAVAQFTPRHIILRTSWVFGGEANFVNTMRRLAKDRAELSVVDDQRGGPTAAVHIAKALLLIAEKVLTPDFDQWGIYHFSGTPAVSWYEFAVEILKDQPAVTVHPIPTSGYPTPAIRPANSVLDCAKIKDIFGIDQPDWREDL